MKFKYLYSLLALILCFMTGDAFAQYPGGVSTGSTRGYKVDYYNGNFSSVSQFGAGSAKATPDNTGYSNKITGTEFNSLDNDYYGMEYTGTLEIVVAGTYTFAMTADDFATLYIDGNAVFSANYTAAGSGSATLAAGDHSIKIKHYELGGSNYASLQFTAVPGGAAGFTLPTDVDGRFVRTDNSKLTAWYKASDLGVTANFGGAGVDKVNSWTNKAPDYVGIGNLNYASTGGYTTTSVNSQVNFNPGVPFDGDDTFNSGSTIKGLSLRGATKTLFMVNDYVAPTTGQSATWMFYHGDNAANQRIGFYKNDGTGNQLAVVGAGVTNASTYIANEPKLLGGIVDQVTGAAAPINTNLFTLRSNGNTGTTNSVFSNADYDPDGLYLAGMNKSYTPEAIFYPFALTQVQERKVNTYLAVKYGITLGHDYINTSGATIFDLTTNVGYANRIFGIGREMTAEALNQKQSQSQMTSATGYDFLVLSKDASITTTNALNNGVLAEGSYLLMGDNNGALSINAAPATIPTTLTGSCTVNALNRMWKVQNTGAVTNVTLQAGSATIGSFTFPGNAASVSLWIDATGTGNFTNATVVQAATVSLAGVATFKGITLPNGSVFTFGWNVVSPGGVNIGLKLWSKADDNNVAIGNIATWYDQSPNGNNLIRAASSAVTKVDNKFNYNPAIYFGGSDNQFVASTSPLGMNGINAYAEFYVLSGKGGFASGLPFDEIITLGGGNHRWESSTTTLNTGSYGVYGSGTAATVSGAGIIPTMNNLGLYSNTANGTNAILRTNGVIRGTTVTSTNLSLSGNFRIGTDVDPSDGNYNSFYAPELIVYNTSLSTTQIAQVNSYLGIKYSIPLSDGLAIDYLASDGSTKPWLANATYKYGVFGIGRDDCSGLLQKQAKSYVDGTDNVAFGLTALAGNNVSNVGNFSNNRQFILIANDGVALASINTGIPANFLASSCNAYRYARTWKVKNTGSVTNALQLTIGNASDAVASNWLNPTLVINSSGDATFATGTTTLIKATSVSGGVATFDNVTLPDGVVFTLCYTLAFPGGVGKPTAGTTNIGGIDYTNGLTYKLYSTTTGNVRDLETNPLGTGTDALLGTGYYNNAEGFHNFVIPKISNNFGIELTGKIYIPAGITQIGIVNPDDNMVLWINGNIVVKYTNATTGASYLDVSSLARPGYYDIKVQGAQNTGGINFQINWFNNSISPYYFTIPDVNFFTQVSGPSAWYEADDNKLAVQADGTNLAGLNWSDLSGNGNTVTGAAGNNPIYYSTTSPATNSTIGIRNYNPSIYLTADQFATSAYLNGFAYGKTGKSVVTVGSNNNNSTETIYTGYGRDGVTGSNFGLTRLGSGKLQLFTYGNNLTESTAFYNSASYSTDIISAQLNISGLASIYANGVSRASANLASAFNTYFNDNDQLTVGSVPDYSGVNYTGNLNEVIYYPWDLSATERQKVNSYLAIKWGTTLDQTTPTDYLASDGSSIWNASLNTAFKNDITGIGRDDCGNLNQKQSTSTDGNDIVAIGKGSVATTNANNTNTFTNNKSFLMFAHNNATNSFTNFSTDVPSIGAACYKRLNREWLAQPTNTPGPISMVVGKNSLFTFSAATFKPVLLISNTAGSYAAATVVQATRVYQGIAYFDNVTIAANQYFTFAFIEAAPGGVTSGLTTWLNSDYGAFTDVTQTTSASNDGDVVKLLSNLKVGATFSNVQSVNASYDPVYKLGSFNYNNGILFDGIDDVLATAGNINTTDYRSTTAMTSILAGYNLGSGSQNVFWYHEASAGGNKTSMERAGVFWDASAALSRTPTLTVPEIYTFANSTSGTSRLLSNLKLVGSGSLTGTNAVNGRFRIGNNSLTGSGGFPANFFLGEIVVYSDDKGAATTLEMRKIHSYMATKYGFTLDKTAMLNAYVASDGTTQTYNDVNYWNRITGIGRDDCSAFEQKQSFSQEATGALVKISNGTNGLTANNAANTASFATNNSFLLFGDNNKSATWTGVDKIVDATSGNNLMRLNRIWHTKETGTVGTVYLQVPDNSSALATKLPAAISSINTIYLVVANAASGGSFNGATTIKEMIPSGTDWTVTYDFADGDYYTFATVASCLAPAGISDGLTSWYKATDMIPGAIADGTANALVDVSGNNLSLSRNTIAGTADVATVLAGTVAYNYNKYITLANNAGFAKTALTESAIFSATEGSLYVLGNPTNSLFGFVSSGTSSTNKVGIDGAGVYMTGFSNYQTGTAFSVRSLAFKTDAATPTTRISTREDGLAGIRTGTIEGGSLSALAVRSDYVLGLGVFAGGSATSAQVISEAFTFNRNLSVDEQDKLDTYLSIKYGRTLSHNYYNPAYNGSNAASTTLYDVSTYGNRVFGVGNDIAGCFYQNQSTSVLSGSMLKISVDGAILAENSQGKAIWNNVDRAYTIMGDDNGAITWTDTNKPAICADNSCAKRITRQWKVTTTDVNPSLLITIPAFTGAAATKLPDYLAVNASNAVYMVVNDNAIFTTNGNQVEIPMTLNATTNEWEASTSFAANTTKYITFIYRPKTCRTNVITNPMLPNKKAN